MRADEQTGWSEEAHASGLNLPDENFDYDGFVKREFGGKSPVPHGIHWFLVGSCFGSGSSLITYWLR